jgi:lactoylglutathione lyase
MTPDVEQVCLELEDAGVKFQKRPHEGKMKGIAFALDPDGYWIEIIPRSPESPIKLKYTFAQTMFRVKDPVKSLNFYRNLLGMTLLREAHLNVGTEHGFSLYFLSHLSKEELANVPADPQSPESSEYIKRMFPPVIELTHNHGTEHRPDFKYHNGNDTDQGQLHGFGHVGFLVDDLDKACQYLEDNGVPFKKRPSEGTMRGLAFAYDPDGYW